jgi:hypothetical protein
VNIESDNDGNSFEIYSEPESNYAGKRLRRRNLMVARRGRERK